MNVCCLLWPHVINFIYREPAHCTFLHVPHFCFNYALNFLFDARSVLLHFCRCCFDWNINLEQHFVIGTLMYCALFSWHIVVCFVPVICLVLSESEPEALLLSIYSSLLVPMFYHFMGMVSCPFSSTPAHLSCCFSFRTSCQLKHQSDSGSENFCLVADFLKKSVDCHNRNRMFPILALSVMLEFFFPANFIVPTISQFFFSSACVIAVFDRSCAPCYVTSSVTKASPCV